MSAGWSENDRVFMEHALLVAERGRGKVSPNPLVGCVLVKDGVVIAEDGKITHLSVEEGPGVDVSSAENMMALL